MELQRTIQAAPVYHGVKLRAPKHSIVFHAILERQLPRVPLAVRVGDGCHKRLAVVEPKRAGPGQGYWGRQGWRCETLTASRACGSCKEAPDSMGATRDKLRLGASPVWNEYRSPQQLLLVRRQLAGGRHVSHQPRIREGLGHEIPGAGHRRSAALQSAYPIRRVRRSCLRKVGTCMGNSASSHA